MCAGSRCEWSGPPAFDLYAVILQEVTEYMSTEEKIRLTSYSTKAG